MPAANSIFGGTAVEVSMMLGSLQKSLSELANYETQAACSMAQAQSAAAVAGAKSCVDAGNAEKSQLYAQMGASIAGAVASGVAFGSSAFSTVKLGMSNPVEKLREADSFTKTMNNSPRTQAAVTGGRQGTVLVDAEATDVAAVEGHIRNGEFDRAERAMKSKIYSDEQRTRVANAVKAYKDSQSDPYNSEVAVHARRNETFARFSDFTQTVAKAAESSISATQVANKAQAQATQTVCQSAAQQLNQNYSDINQKKDKVFDELMQLIQGLPQAIRAAQQYQG